jgi:hypothetical protein
MQNETRFRMVEKINPEGFKRFARQAQEAAERRIAVYKHMADLRLPEGAAQPELVGAGSGNGSAG